MENKSQRAFIRAIEKAIEKANAAYGTTVQASRITPANEIAVAQYLRSLETFNNACNRMILDLNIFFGEGSEEIGTRHAGLVAREPNQLN
jgi:hypothetical protein